MNWWLITAYAVFFVGFSAYALRMALRQKDLDRRVEQLRSRLDEDSPSESRD
jgi:CcmD family protein